MLVRGSAVGETGDVVVSTVAASASAVFGTALSAEYEEQHYEADDDDQGSVVVGSIVGLIVEGTTLK